MFPKIQSSSLVIGFRLLAKGIFPKCILSGFCLRNAAKLPNIFGETYASVEFRFDRMKKRILRLCNNEVKSIEVMYQCHFQQQLKTSGTKIHQFFNSRHPNSLTPRSKPPPMMVLRQGCRGGTTELYRLVAKSTPTCTSQICKGSS